MNQLKFVIQSLKHFKRQHFAVFLATLISTAVLTGALIVGDSVKYSLNKLVDKRLGKIEFGLISGDRFVRSQLANEISEDLNVSSAAIMMLNGIATNTENQKRVNKVQILGVENDFWKLSEIEMPVLNNNEIIISQNIAQNLKLKIGDELLLRIQNAEIIPLNAPFTSDENQTLAIRLKVKYIAHDNELGRFSLRNNQLAPFNIFIGRDFISQRLDLNDLCNLIVIDGNNAIGNDELNQSLRKNWTLKDASLKIEYLKESKDFELLSDRIFLDLPVSSAISKMSVSNEKLLTYFVNSFKSKNKSTPYSFVTAASEEFLGEKIKESEIVINSWLAEDLNVNVGDSLILTYYIIGPLRTLEERSKSFLIKSILPTQGKVFNKSLMPDFPGLSDAGDCGDWDAGIPIDLKKIRQKDEDYWDEYKGTPKAIISLEEGMKLWGNKFGDFTAIRFHSNEISKSQLEQKIHEKLLPKDLGLMFSDLRLQGKNAASKGVDFGELFLSLSFFVIAAAILLLVLIYSLNLENRSSETGILFGMGFTQKQIIKLRIYESLLTIILGASVGGLFGIFYNYLMIWGLNSVWNNAVHADMLEVFVNPNSLVIGVFIGIFTSLISIYFVSRSKLKKSIISIINEQEESFKTGKLLISKSIVFVGFATSISIVVYSILNSIEGNSSMMLFAGFLFLTACISLFSIIISPKKKSGNNKLLGLFSLSRKNASRKKNRSIAVVALLAIGTFTIIVTGANRKTFSGSEEQRSSGTGGFKLWVENTVPILQNLNTNAADYNLENEAALDNATFIQFHSLVGDDASCLNLNQVQKPQIISVNPDLFDTLKAFSFANLLVEIKNPWLELNVEYPKNIIPAIADQTVIQWGLMKKIGDTLTYHNEFGEEIYLLLVGGLNASIFQGNILISDKTFIKNFPSSGGSKIMIVNAPNKDIPKIKDLLNTYLTDYGISISLASNRLAAFYSVTNTYLTIFMILGGLGVILGTFGLGIVLMKIIIERKKEIAVLEAIGFSKYQVMKLIIIENTILLIAGIAIGFVAAVIGIIPSILSSAFNIPGTFLFVLVLMVFVSGMFWIIIPTTFVMRDNLIKNLRSE
jgi:ABC-type lipoprotein release transport system permease subunit